MSETILSVFTDGGCVGRNPSPLGGTWAYVLAGEGDAVLAERSGRITPADCGLPTVSNNVAELWAAVEALEALPAGWSGVLYTDSNVTLLRVRTPHRTSMAGVPARLFERLCVAKDRLGAVELVLLGGHPTRAELAAGRRKDGHKVHAFNVRCDQLCNMEAALR